MNNWNSKVHALFFYLKQKLVNGLRNSNYVVDSNEVIQNKTDVHTNLPFEHYSMTSCNHKDRLDTWKLRNEAIITWKKITRIKWDWKLKEGH